jgi:hypothetical protein
MASGTLGQSAPAAATNTTVYTVPAAKVASTIVSIMNRGPNSAAVRLAVAATGTPTTSEWLEYDTPLEAGGVLERTGIVASAGKNFVVYASTATVSVSVYGYED